MKEGMNRRELLQRGAMGLVAGPAGAFASGETTASEAEPVSQPLRLTDFEPRSALHVHETSIERPRYPVVDAHTHLCWGTHSEAGIFLSSQRTFLAPPEELLPVMDRCGVHTMVNFTGGYGAGLTESIARYDRAHPGRFLTMTEPIYEHFLDPNYPSLQADAIVQAHREGACALKILKTLGLYLREGITTGPLVKIDDPRFDPMWDACGQLGMPVAIHVSDPIAFFAPIDRYNERYEELANHPDWSFHGRDFPSNDELLAARDRVIARHPRTRFILLHVGNFAENLARVSATLDRFPNATVDIAARIGELGRQPRTARAFFDRYQDRILFGTDATPHGDDFPQQLFNERLYQIYYRFLETNDEYFDYAPSSVPPQGRWRIYGINLPDAVLKKVYNANAVRELGIKLQEK
jgi:predicted TIM-barrel fold metal-dependent hydrolase